MSASNYLEGKILDHLFGGTSYAPLATVYVSLHTADPGETGASELASTGGYARVAVTNNTTNWPAASGGVKSNGAAVTFPQASADWATATHFAIWDAASAGNCLVSGALGASKTVQNGDTASFAAAALTITAD